MIRLLQGTNTYTIGQWQVVRFLINHQVMVSDDTSVFCGRLRTIGNMIANGHTLDVEIKHIEGLKLLDMLGPIGKELPGARVLVRRKQLKRLWLHGNPKARQDRDGFPRHAPFDFHSG